nr:hypothetical protein [Pseudomonadota bacterium]
MNKNTNTQTDTETFHMSLQITHFFPNFFRVGKYLLPMLAGLFILAACGGGGAAPTTVEPTEDPCVANPFSAGCTTPEAEMAREEKIKECIAGDAVGTATCMDAVAANTCLEDPFDKTCTADTVDETFVEFLEPAKVAREAYCRQGNNNINNTDLCGNAVTTLCTANPFDAICGANDDVANVAARQTFCRTNLSNNRCTATISTFCATINAGNFADALCGTPVSAVLRGAYCVGLNGVDVPSGCGDDATEGSLVRAYCTSGSSAALGDTANCATSLANACLT